MLNLVSGQLIVIHVSHVSLGAQLNKIPCILSTRPSPPTNRFHRHVISDDADMVGAQYITAEEAEDATEAQRRSELPHQA